MVDYSEAAETIWAYANGSWFHDGAAGVPYVRSDIAERQIAELRAQLATAYKVKAMCNDEANRERHLRIAAEAREGWLSEALEKGRKNVAAVMKALMETGSRENLLLADAMHKADDAAREALFPDTRTKMTWSKREEERKEEIRRMETSQLVRLIIKGAMVEYRFDSFWAEDELNRRLPLPARAEVQTAELVSHERQVLEMCAGEREWEHGAWTNACLEMLKESGYVSRGLGLTEKGRAELAKGEME